MEVLGGMAHTKERAKATRCDAHAEQRRKWREAKKSTDRRGQPAPDWIPLPVSAELKHTEFKVETPEEHTSSRQRVARELDRIDGVVARQREVIAVVGGPSWLRDATNVLESAAARIRAELGSTPGSPSPRPYTAL